MAKQLSLYSADEIRAMIAQMEAGRAGRSAASVATTAGANPDQNGESVDPNEKAQVHDVDPGLWRGNRAT